MSLYDTKLAALDGTPDVLANEKGKVTLLVNVASFCGLTPQFAATSSVVTLSSCSAGSPIHSSRSSGPATSSVKKRPTLRPSIFRTSSPASQP